MKMRRMFFSGLRIAALLPSIGVHAATPSAEAAPAPELQPMRIAARSVRVDVKEACPAIQSRLQQEVGLAWWRVGLTGTMQVQFQVENQRVTGITASGISSEYRPYIRKALRGLDCVSASPGADNFRFLLVIKDLDDESQSDRVALLDAE